MAVLCDQSLSRHGNKKRRMFQLKAPFQPAGDQPKAIESLVTGLRENKRHQVLMGVTGSGKTFTMANVIEFSLARQTFGFSRCGLGTGDPEVGTLVIGSPTGTPDG